jgi:4-amino-4-deoxy-L-arabinose transferase-like glycosyltransferase
MVGEEAQGRPGPRGSLLWSLSLVLVLLVHVLYELWSDLPPLWDMAYHQDQGILYLRAWEQGQFLSRFADLSTYYPPLYYLQEAVVLALFSYNQFLPLLANLPGILLLSYSTFLLAGHYIGPRYSWLVGVLPLMFPLVAWTSRESLLDVPLSGWVAVALVIVLRSRMLEVRRTALLLAPILALGMLTKWTFVVFLFFPLCYAIYASGDRKRSLLNLVDGCLLAMPLMFVWYLPNLGALAERFALTSGTGTVLEGDPRWTQLQAWIYYLRCLSSYYLYLPLTLLFLAGMLLRRYRNQTPAYLGLLWWALAGSLVILTLMDAKDPRYTMPVVAPLAILLVLFWRHRPALVYAIAVLATLQFLTISFDLLGRPVKLAVLHIQNDTDYLSLSREWVFFQTHYFDAAGPARRENWPIREILSVIPAGQTVGCIPDLPRFNPGALQLKARVDGREQKFLRIGHSAESLESLGGLPYVIGKTGPQGISYITAFNQHTYDRLRQLDWPVVGQWGAPDGTIIRLWQNPKGFPD